VLVLVGAALAVKLAGPVAAAAAELLHIVLIVAGVIVGVGAVSLGGLLAWRWRHSQSDAARAIAVPPRVVRAAPPLSAERPAIAPPAEVHLHLHGMTPEEVAAVLRQHGALPPPQD
jgi:hypothetical protein